ncbi:DUF3618 domain-containing protein [Streptomyces radiopugnans]|nr:DUF3618 domain-containing protein [Streptomyces radiopugnans]
MSVSRDTRQTEFPNTPGIPSDPETPAELRERIDRTRRELGDTIEELAARADVKALAQRKAAGAVRAGLGATPCRWPRRAGPCSPSSWPPWCCGGGRHSGGGTRCATTRGQPASVRRLVERMAA